MKIKLGSETPTQLNWLVAKCEGWDMFDEDGVPITELDGSHMRRRYSLYSPATDWSIAGPVIERERIHILPTYDIGKTESGRDFKDFKGWKAVRTDRPYWLTVKTWQAATPLIAAMRVLVASKLGDEVEIPEELK